MTVTGLPFWSSTLELERLGVLAAELEDVADLDAAGQLQQAAAARGHGSPSWTTTASTYAVDR